MSKPKSKYKHICIRCVNNHLMKPHTGMLTMQENSCISFFLFTEQGGGHVHWFIEANALVAYSCINNFVNWHCIFPPVVDQKMNKGVFVVVVSRERVPLPNDVGSNYFLKGQCIWTSSIPLNIFYWLPLVDIENNIYPGWPICRWKCGIKYFISSFVKC